MGRSKNEHRTFTEHVAYQISQSVIYKQESIVRTGEGVWKKCLLERMVI